MKQLLHTALLTVTGIISFVSSTVGDTERCRFPSDWKGKWYQNGLGEVIIRSRVMTKKGHCFEHYDDYYLVKKRDEDCYQCLLVIERHPNLIQYRESYCLGRDTLRNICGQIQVERPLYTLVRDPAIPTECPFKDAYYFDYNDQASGFCDNALSYAKPCAGHSKYQLHFKHCKEWAMFANSDLTFECLATWKDGSDFLYGQFSGHEIANKDESFRCFKYQNFGTEMYLAMSVDATCQGLRNPQDGPVTMQFSKDIYGWPRASCTYPHWLAGHTWRDIEGKHSISFLSDAHVMTDQYRRRVSADPEIQSEHRCVAQLGNEFSEEGATVTVFSFTTTNCMSKHQCLRFKRSKSGKLEVFKGGMADFDSHDECLKDEHYGDAEIWMREDTPAIDCPIQGSYLVEDSEGCHKRISIGCQNSTLLSFSSTCVNSHAFSLQCLLTWQDMGRTYLLAKEPGVDSRLVSCFSFKERHNYVHLTPDRKCGGGGPSGLLDKSVKSERLERESCEAAANSPLLPVRPLPAGHITYPAPETTTSSRHTETQEYKEADNPDDYYGIDFHYTEINPDPNLEPDDPEVTRFPLPSNHPHDSSSQRDSNHGDEGEGEAGWIRGQPDDDSLSLAEEIASRIENNKKYKDYKNKPPVYSQVSIPPPTGESGGNSHQGASSAVRHTLVQFVNRQTMCLHVSLLVLWLCLR